MKTANCFWAMQTAMRHARRLHSVLSAVHNVTVPSSGIARMHERPIGDTVGLPSSAGLPVSYSGQTGYPRHCKSATASHRF